LCFTVPAIHENDIHNLAETLDLPLTRIGTIITGTPEIFWYHHDNSVELHINGWEHFHHGETGKTS
jgi:thiamine-monophosphate kinase